jgi:hypothetical protein
MKASMPENAQDRAAFTYNAAADFYDASPLGFWDYFGRRTSNWLLSRVVHECSMFVAGLERPRSGLQRLWGREEQS